MGYTPVSYMMEQPSLFRWNITVSIMRFQKSTHTIRNRIPFVIILPIWVLLYTFSVFWMSYNWLSQEGLKSLNVGTLLPSVLNRNRRGVPEHAGTTSPVPFRTECSDLILQQGS